MPISWFTVLYATVSAASVTLGLLHLSVWFRRREARAYLFFSIAANAAGK
jgi:hypothetical protein